MPLYQCVVAEGSVSGEQRRSIAAELTRIHCEATDAPEEFVDVLFMDVPAGSGFTAGGALSTSRVAGYIRAGRTPEVRERIMREITEAWTEVTGDSARHVIVNLLDIPAAWIMKGGEFMPEPGKEAEWLARVGA